MKRKRWIVILLSVLVFGAIFSVWSNSRSNLYNSYKPPKSIINVHQLLKWLKDPDYVIKHTVEGKSYFEIVKNIPVWKLIIFVSAGPPSYTIDESGKLIGWSPDNGDYHTPSVIDTVENQRKIIKFKEFIVLLGKMKIGTEQSVPPEHRDRGVW